MKEFNSLGNAILDPPSPGIVGNKEFQWGVHVIGNQESRFEVAVFPDDNLPYQPIVVAQRNQGFMDQGVGELSFGVRDEDGSSLLRPEIAMGKAWGVLGMGLGGRELARRAAKNQMFFGALSDLSGGRMVPVPGGVLIRSNSGEILGAVGISGDASEKDEICVIKGDILK